MTSTGEHVPARLVTGTPPAQVDYREFPSSRQDPATPAGSVQLYGQPLDDTAFSVSPPTDETFKAYDSPTDAMRFNGINSPEQQHVYLSSGDPQSVTDKPGGWASER